MPTSNVFLHTWEDINPEQHRSHISAEREGGGWSNHPKTLTVPEGWRLGVARDNSVQLYDDKGKHVAFVRVGHHGKSVEVAGLFGVCWLALSDAEEGSVCCPTCGHPM